VVRWLDSSSVQLPSTHTAVKPMTTIKCWDRKQHKYVNIPCTAIVKEYSDHIVGLDLFHMLMPLYRVHNKNLKWYRRVFLWVLNLGLAVVNSWLLYRRHADQKRMPAREQLSLLHMPLFTNDVVGQWPPSAAATSLSSSPESQQQKDESTCPKKRHVLSNTGTAACYDNTNTFKSILSTNGDANCHT